MNPDAYRRLVQECVAIRRRQVAEERGEALRIQREKMWERERTRRAKVNRRQAALRREEAKRPPPQDYASPYVNGRWRGLAS